MQDSLFYDRLVYTKMAGKSSDFMVYQISISLSIQKNYPRFTRAAYGYCGRIFLGEEQLCEILEKYVENSMVKA